MSTIPFISVLPAFLPPVTTATRRPRSTLTGTPLTQATTKSPRIPLPTAPRHCRLPITASTHPPAARPATQERLLRLERALATAIQQERYTDAATLRDALNDARTSDPLLSTRAELKAAVDRQDFKTAATLRDKLATLTAHFARGGDPSRRVDRLLVLRGRSHPEHALRAATVSPTGDLQLTLDADTGPLAAEYVTAPASGNPRVYLQPTWSPSGDFIAMTEITFNIDTTRVVSRGIAVAEATSALILINAFDGTLARRLPLRKPPFFYYWSPDGHCLTFLSNDPTSNVTSVALSALQVVAPARTQEKTNLKAPISPDTQMSTDVAPDAKPTIESDIKTETETEPSGGLPLDSISGPLASGHPFLYDFCPRDPSRIIAHMGDCSTVALLPVSLRLHERRVLTSSAGAFGTPQWHPLPGRDGREVVLFVETEPTPPDAASTSSKDPNNGDNDGDEADPGAVVSIEGGGDGNAAFEKFLSNGSTLLESVLRKGAESLGLSSRKVGQTLSNDAAKKIEEKLNNIEDKLRRLLNANVEISISSGDDDDDEVDTTFEGLRSSSAWGSKSNSSSTINRLIMCDADRPEQRRTLARFRGVMAFKLSPDGKTLAMLVTNPDTGDDELTISRGDFSPDTVANGDDDRFSTGNALSHAGSDADIILSTPSTRVLAFFWSPDSSKLLFLCSLRESRAGAAQWATFDMVTSKVVRYEKYFMSGVYIHCLNFFDQFAVSMTPWSPDSSAFCYPGRPLTQAELEHDQDQAAGSSPSLAALFMQRDGSADDKRFAARVQKVPDTANGDTTAEDAVTVVDNVEYTCWSPC